MASECLETGDGGESGYPTATTSMGHASPAGDDAASGSADGRTAPGSDWASPLDATPRSSQGALTIFERGVVLPLNPDFG